MLQNIKKLLADNIWWLAIAATIILGILSLISVPKVNLGLNLNSPDKYLHIIAYFGLSTLWYAALYPVRQKLSSKFLLIGLIFIYGIILEALQGELTSYRTADWYDILANAVGILLAALLSKTICKWLYAR